MTIVSIPLVVVRALVPLRPHRAAAAQGAGQHFADKGQRIALVLAEGHDRAARLAVHRARVGRRPTLAVEQVPGFSRSPLLRATRTLPIAMTLVAMSRRIGRPASGPGIAMHTGLVPNRPSVPRHGATDGALIGDIDEMERHQPSLGAHLAIGANPADVVGVAQCHDRDPALARFGDADHRRLARRDLAVSALAVIDDQRAVLADDAPLAVGTTVPFPRLRR